MSKRLLNVNVRFDGHAEIVICERSQFLSQVCKLFNVEEKDIEIYERNTLNRIGVDSILDLMKLEVKRKNNFSSRSGASTSKGESSHAEIIRKLTENAVLTGLERSYIINVFKNLGSTNGDSNNFVKKTRNIKIQVYPRNLMCERAVECQTEEIMEHVPSKRSLKTDIMYKSKRLAASEKPDPTQARKLLQDSYDERRTFILTQNPPASFVKEKYPLLFTLSEVRNEIDLICFSGKCEQFLQNIDKYSKHVLSLVREDDPLLTMTKTKMAQCTTTSQRQYAQQVGSLLMVSSLMNEERTYLKLIDQPIETSIYPYIEAQAKLGEIFFDHPLFKLYVEGLLVCEASNFKEAILCLVGIYYIFNIKYPDTNWNTFALFEQIYLEKFDTNDLDEFTLQIIRSLYLKEQASHPSTSRS